MQNLTLPLSQLINDLEVHDLEPTLQEYKITPIYVQKSQSTKVVDLIKEYFDNSYNNINNLLESQNLFDRKKHEHCIQQGSDIYLDQQKDILNQSNRDFQISQLKSLETQNISQVYVESPHKQSYSCLSKLQQSPLPVDVFISQKLLNSNSSQKCACSAFEDLQYTKFMDESAPETFDKGVHRYDDVLIKEVKKVQQEDKQIPLYIKNQRRFEQIKQGSLKLSVADQYIKQSILQQAQVKKIHRK
ncbi:hypothetical protein SS50377_26505 [Spironucleus salmonicida]|uniref:Uncharacterized protein n=1 Tax=Spironucleus salmonicida TaxID=348837 RepID=V6LL01_9EUKA|nr:hypothetical protein SS50377_26505 [Spironucleus salmonicida]|eukprot:EST41359.1 Hypothetical protein SS50377_19074 [Spironucleus salmonicida]